MLGLVLVAVTIGIVYNELRVAGVFAGGVLRKYSPLGPVGARVRAGARADLR